MNPVREHLRLLSIFHYVVGGMGYLISLVPCIHLAIGIFFLVAPEETFQVPPPPRPVPASPEPGAETTPVAPVAPVPPFPSKLFGVIFTTVASVIIVSGMIFSTCIVLAGRRLASLRSYTFCMVIAGIECFIMPFGTVLGIFTILTLIKPETRQLFGLSPDEAVVPG